MQGALVVNADDLGVSRGATLGIVRAHGEGIVTSASLAATTPFYEHAVETCARECPELGLGLHFTLTSGRPLAPARDVPLLVDESGEFRWRFVALLRAAAVRKWPELLDQIDIELEAQLQRLIRDGVDVDHIDGERHVHLIPGIFERVAAAARRHDIQFVRFGRDIGRRFVGPREALGLVASGGFLKSWLLSELSRRARRHLAGGVEATARVFSADDFASYIYSGRIDRVLKRLLARPPEGGVTEIMVHPGIPAESRGVALGNRELERYLGLEDRQRELEACIEARDWMSTSGHGWTLTTFKRLAQESPGRC
jgi:predicted glycoside hydrolase/deacetylase ChbG (UPF0249 family)